MKRVQFQPPRVQTSLYLQKSYNYHSFSLFFQAHENHPPQKLYFTVSLIIHSSILKHSNSEIILRNREMENCTLTGLLKKAAFEFPRCRALSVSGKFDLTHERLQELIEHAAARLVDAGVNAGDVVALTFPNTVEVRLILNAIFYVNFCVFSVCLVLPLLERYLLNLNKA